MKWSLHVFLKYLTPSVALRDSRLSSPSYTSASPTSRFFCVGPRFVSSSTVISNQYPINSSYFNQDVDPVKKWWNFSCDSTSCCTIVMPTLRDVLQPDSVDYFLSSVSQSLIVGIVEVLKQYPLTRDLVRDKILYFTTQQPRSATTLWLLVCSFCGNRT